jgi:hypothetical protein
MDETEDVSALDMRDERLAERAEGIEETSKRRQLERGNAWQSPGAASGTLSDQTNEPVAPLLPTQQLRK